MKPKQLNRIYETDDGIFNYEWREDHPKYKDLTCEWKVLGGGGSTDGKLGKWWCVECGMVLCDKHRKGHQDSAQHRRRMEKFDLKPYKVRLPERD